VIEISQGWGRETQLADEKTLPEENKLVPGARHSLRQRFGGGVGLVARESMSPPSTSRLPTVSGNTPTFLGYPRVELPGGLGDLDAVVAGLPWEGTNTWGSYSGCEQTPKGCRYASLRYGTGYLPEYDVDIGKRIRVGDAGDLPVHPSDVLRTFAEFEAGAAEIFASGAVPIFIGGDHSVSYPVLKALSERHQGRVGVIHFDSHFDNAEDYAGDRLARCCPLRRISELPGLDPRNIVHIGIRGPRNSPSQMGFARESGATVFTMAEVRRQGRDAVISQAVEVASNGTDGFYVTVCSDIIDHAFNPGGPADFGGLSAGDMCDTLFRLAQVPMLGLDLVEAYPLSDVNNASIHLVVWMAIYALAGLATNGGR